MTVQNLFKEDLGERRYDLDWVRIGAFMLLILYHVGMYYVTWDWHVKSPHASHDAAVRLAPPIIPWLRRLAERRLAGLGILFCILGCSCWASRWPARARLGLPWSALVGGP
jgi:hypothetical protein